MKDTDKMPFGKYKGKEMQEVPAEYLIFIYEEKKATPEVRAYIEENMHVLQEEIKRSKK